MILWLILLGIGVLAFMFLAGDAAGRAGGDQLVGELGEQLGEARAEIVLLRAQLDGEPACKVCADNPLVMLNDALTIAEDWRDREIARRSLDHPELYEYEIRAMIAESEDRNPYQGSRHGELA